MNSPSGRSGAPAPTRLSADVEVPKACGRRLWCVIRDSAWELVAEAGEFAGPGAEGSAAGVPVGVEADDVDGGGGEGVLKAQATLAGSAEAGAVEGLVDGALDPGA